MTTPYPPQPRRLMRDPNNKLIGGVCSGVAKYLNMDANLVRILTVLISLFTGVPIVLYIIALFVMPEERNEPQPPHVSGPQPGAYGYQAPAQPTTDNVWGSGGAPWEQPHAEPAPAPQPPSWQQPPASQSSSYDTAPATEPTDQAPATAMPSSTPAAAPEPEPVPESEARQPGAEGTSDWESAPADTSEEPEDKPKAE